MSTSTSSDVIWTSNFIKLTLAHLCGAMGYASMLLLPLYLHTIGGSRSEIGFIMALASITGLITRPLVGWSLDEIGRKASLTFGCILTVIAMLLIYWVEEIDWVIYLSRTLFGLGEGFLFTGYFAYATDLLPARRRTEGLALFGVAGLVPLLVNPIANLTGYQGESLGNFIVYVAGLVSLSIILILWIKHPTSIDHPSQEDQSHTQEPPHEMSPPDHSSINTPPSSRWHIFLSAPLRPLWFASFIFAGSVALFMTFISVVAENRAMEMPTMSWFTYVAGAVGARLFGAKLPEKVGPHRLVQPALLSYALALGITSVAYHSTWFLCAGLFAGLAHGYCFPVLTSLIVSAVPQAIRGSALAVFTGLWGFSAVVFTPLGGWIADQWSDQSMFITMSICVTLSALYLHPKRFMVANQS